jgi:hypothetical protein
LGIVRSLYLTSPSYNLPHDSLALRDRRDLVIQEITVEDDGIAEGERVRDAGDVKSTTLFRNLDDVVHLEAPRLVVVVPVLGNVLAMPVHEEVTVNVFGTVKLPKGTLDEMRYRKINPTRWTLVRVGVPVWSRETTKPHRLLRAEIEK